MTVRNPSVLISACLMGTPVRYDGDFAGRKHVGNGVTAALLTRHGIEIFTPARLGELLSKLGSLSSA